MGMTGTAAAIMVLFGGQDLDGWTTIAGEWMAREGAMVCRAAPASIRSTYESDGFVLEFEYRRSGKGTNRLAVHSKMTTGGPVLLLTPRGVTKREAGWSWTPAVPEDEWIGVRVEADPDLLHAAARAGGKEISDVRIPVDRGSRGFIRFEATEPGIEIRDVKVRELNFTPMFDGKTLDGWEIVRPKDPDDPGWVIENGVVRCRGRRSSWLRTLRTYDNFVLRLEYQLPPRGNSGIFLRAPIEGRVSRIGLEIQLLDDVADRGRIKPAQHTGSIYDGIAPEIRVPAPVNEWNAIEVLCDGKHIRTTLNGIELYDADLEQDAEKDTNRHRRPLATRRTVGFIGLQDHSSPVGFRNVRIREMR